MESYLTELFRLTRKIENLEQLGIFREAILQRREPDKPRVRICLTGCRAYGAVQIRDAFKSELQKRNLEGEIEIVETGCHGFCARAPVIVIEPQEIFYQQLTPDDVPEIVSETLVKGNIIEKFIFADPASGKRIPIADDVPFYQEQTKNVLRNCGKIDPTNILHYIARDGYAALVKVLSVMTPEEVIETVKASGLRGRGGAGFPTGLKWGFTRVSSGDTKYIVCNADEGDPGAFMDRGVLEGDTHSVLEGMLIAAYAIGAQTGYIYVRAEYPIAVEHVKIAIAQATQLGLLGENILGTDFNFELKIREGAGAFVCGEETALMASIEGKRGMPRTRPPFPTQSGLWGQPTNINNVETYANINPIILQGAEQYSRLGTEKSKGTKIFALAGKVNNTGMVEIPMGTALREVVFDIGGGILNDREFKAVQIGGPSGGCVPAKHLDIPIDYDSLTGIGAIMGSGGMIVMDEKTCIVDIARYFMEFVQNESCGKCVPCRLGTEQMLEILTRITQGEGKEEDIDLLFKTASIVKKTSLCGLGQTAPNPVLTSILYFRDEYEAHIKEKRCPACVCEALVVSPCHHSCPINENAHTYIRLIAEGKFDEAIAASRERNPFPSICGRVCYHPCELKCRRSEIDEPIAIAALKRFAADYEASIGRVVQPVERQWEEKVAVIGSGPAGLSAAYHLTKRGYAVTVFEALSVAGGMMAVGIPDYRLPKAVLQKEIDAIEQMGVEIKLNTPVGAELTLNNLFQQGYKAIFIATGTHKGGRLSIEGEDAKGVIEGTTFLQEVNLGKKLPLGEKVAVIGGGNVAIDAARTALRLGAKEVAIVYRRSREEMPAHQWEVEEAENEGVKFHFLALPMKVLSNNGTVTDMECIRMRLGERDESGRRRPIPIEGSEFTLEVDTVIPAISQSPDLFFLINSGNDGLETTKQSTFVVDQETLATNRDGVFAGGDCVSGPTMVVEAIASGEQAAMSIHSYLRDGKVEELHPREKARLDAQLMEKPTQVKSEGGLEQQPRQVTPVLPLEQRQHNFAEIELCFTEEMAVTEAKRCLQCQFED
ncbi:NADH-quinone oxidoreductase subunit NuoF [bacterium]|nr:NADH-quinone oxidoreductase subunit NuoF [bacterium]